MRTPRRLAAILAAGTMTALALAGCDAGSSTTLSTANPSAAATATSETLAQDVKCSTLDMAQDSDALPTVKDSKDSIATVTWKKGAKAPTELISKTLKKGSGAAVKESDMVTVDYVGWQWDKSKPFDTSATTGNAFTTPLTSVVPGWRCGLAGHKKGERVLLSVPGKLAYGESSTTGLPTGTLVFVVDIKDTFTKESVIGATAEATMEGEAAAAARGVEVSGKLGEAATIKVKDGATEPTGIEVIVLARGKGKALAMGDSVTTYMDSTVWDNSQHQSLWELGSPQTLTITEGSGLEDLVGVPVGSRVVILTPGSTDSSGGQSVPAQAHVMDLDRLS